MSLHYEFYLCFDLREDTPSAVIETLSFMVKGENEPVSPPNHLFFLGESWKSVLKAHPNDNCWFPGLEFSDFRRVYRFTLQDVDQYRYTLSFRCSMLDDAFVVEWWSLAMWLAPYSETQGFVGFYREADELHPTLIHFCNGNLVIVEVDRVKTTEIPSEQP